MRIEQWFSPASNLMLWAPWLIGPAAWAAHQNVMYASTPVICIHGGQIAYYVATVVAVGVAAVGAGLAARSFRSSRRLAEIEEGRGPGRRRFMAATGFFICLISVAGILVESLPVLTLDPCAGAT